MSLILAYCFLNNYFKKYRYFRILEATAFYFAGEAKQTGHNIACRIKLMTKRPSQNLKFEELWIDDRLYKIRVTNESNQQVEDDFSGKQILFIDIESEVHDKEQKTPPAEKSKSKIFLGYRIDDKQRYLAIDQIPELPGLAVA